MCYVTMVIYKTHCFCTIMLKSIEYLFRLLIYELCVNGNVYVRKKVLLVYLLFPA